MNKHTILKKLADIKEVIANIENELSAEESKFKLGEEVIVSGLNSVDGVDQKVLIGQIGVIVEIHKNLYLVKSQIEDQWGGSWWFGVDELTKKEDGL